MPVFYPECNNTVTYIQGLPVEFILYKDNWNGTTYTLDITNYNKLYTPQIGLPEVSDFYNTKVAVNSALTIPESSSTTITISAVVTPDVDLKVAIFGLEQKPEVVEEQT